MSHRSVPERIFLLEAFPSPQEGAIVEHVVGVWVQTPVTALARLLVVAGHLDEALVEREVVPDGVLPALRRRHYKYCRHIETQMRARSCPSC